MVGGQVQEMGTWEGTFRDSPQKCQESQAELPVLFLRGANCLILQCSTPNKPKVSSIFRGAGLACMSPEGQGRRGHQEASWKQCPEVPQDGPGSRTPCGLSQVYHQDAKAQDPVVPSQLLEPHTLLLVTQHGLRTDGTWVTHPEMLCMTVYTVGPAIYA